MPTTPEFRAKRAAYMRLWNAKNRPHVNAQRLIGRQKNRAKIKARGKAYYEKNKVVFLGKCKVYAEKNKAKISARNARKYAEKHTDPEWREKERKRSYEHFLKNKEHYRANSREYVKNHRKEVNARSKEWAKNNPEKRRASWMNRRANIRASGSLSPRLFETLLNKQVGKCAICHDKLLRYHADHIMPLALGGAHSDENIQLLCPSCNLSKAARHPVDHMQSLGRLL